VDDRRFDALARGMAAPRTRRDAIRGIGKAIAVAVGVGGPVVTSFLSQPSNAATCRAGGTTCTLDAICCSGDCGEPDARGRRRCTCETGKTSCGDQCCERGQMCHNGTCLKPSPTPGSTSTPTAMSSKTPTATMTSEPQETPTNTPTNTATSTSTPGGECEEDDDCGHAEICSQGTCVDPCAGACGDCGCITTIEKTTICMDTANTFYGCTACTESDQCGSGICWASLHGGGGVTIAENNPDCLGSLGEGFIGLCITSHSSCIN
jgi:hypothetical protein